MSKSKKARLSPKVRPTVADGVEKTMVNESLLLDAVEVEVGPLCPPSDPQPQTSLDRRFAPSALPFRTLRAGKGVTSHIFDMPRAEYLDLAREAHIGPWSSVSLSLSARPLR